MSDSTHKLRQMKRTPDFDGPGAQAADAMMTDIQGEGETFYNHSQRTIHFLDGSFVSPGFGIPLSQKALEHPGVKRLIEADELRTKKPADAIDPETEAERARLVHDTGNKDRTAAPSNTEEHSTNAI